MLEEMSDIFFIGFMLSGLVSGLFFTGGGMLSSPGMMNAMNAASRPNATVHNDATHFSGTHKNPKDIDSTDGSGRSIGMFFLKLTGGFFVLFLLTTFVA